MNRGGENNERGKGFEICRDELLKSSPQRKREIGNPRLAQSTDERKERKNAKPVLRGKTTKGNDIPSVPGTSYQEE